MPNISVKSLKEVLKALKYTEEEAKAVLGSTEEVDLSVKDGLSVFTKEELDKVKENAVTSSEPKRMNAARDIVIKDLKEKTGLDFEGKDPDMFVTKFKEHTLAEANIKPQAAKEEYERKETLLKDKIKELEGTVAQKDESIKGIERDNQWKAAIPDGDTLSKDDRLLLLKSRMQEKSEDGKTLYLYKGQSLETELGEALPFNEAIKKVFEMEKWNTSTGDESNPKGDGFGDSSKSKGTPSTREEMKKKMAEQGINPLTKEGREYMEKVKQDNPKLAAV